MHLKKLWILPLVLVAATASAQFSKGIKMIGSSIGTSFIGTGETRYIFVDPSFNYTSKQNQSNINLGPSFGTFFNDQLAGGVQLLVGYSNLSTWRESATNGNTYVRDEVRNTDYGAGIFLRYYLSRNAKFLPFLHVQGNAGSGKTKTEGFYEIMNYRQTYEGVSSKKFYYNASLNLGLTKLISPMIGIDATIGYNFSSNRFTTTTTQKIVDNGTNLSATNTVEQQFNGNGLNIGIGIQVFLRKRSK
jgi:hypothetical protein